MTTLIDDRRVRARDASPARYFYLHMALACAAIAFLGFAPTYFVPLANGTLSASPVIHFHGLLFFTWSLYFVFQTWLAASGRMVSTARSASLGVSLATAMTIFGFLASVHVMQRSAAIGQNEAGIAFSIVPMSGIVFFAVVFVLAIMNTRKPEIHKRLMLLAGISHPRCRGRALVSHLPRASRTARPAAGAGHHRARDGRLSAARRRHGPRLAHRRPAHPVYIYGGVALLAVKVLNWPISETPAWHSFAGGILALAQ